MIRRGEKRLKPIRANAGIAAYYRDALTKLLREMAESYALRLRAQYRRDPPAMAQDEAAVGKQVTANQIDRSGQKVWEVYVDGKALRKPDGTLRWFKSQEAAEDAGLRAGGRLARLTEARKIEDRRSILDMPLVETPAESLQTLLDGMSERWAARFDAVAPKLARYFADSVRSQTDRRLKGILRDGGVTVRATPFTPELRDVMNATVAENVSLIRSIPQQYHGRVAGMVMRSVTEGRDLSFLAKELQKSYAISKRRAALIALTQNNQATAVIQRERQTALGIEEAVWMHSHAGKQPRPTHLANNGKTFNLREGWYDPDPKVRRAIWPGQLINCRCFWRPIVKGLG